MARSDTVFPIRRSDNSRSNTTEIILIFPVIGVLGWFAIGAVSWGRKQECPFSTVLAGELLPLLQAIVLILTVQIAYLVLRHLLLHASPWLRRRLDIEITCSRRWHQRWGTIGVLSLAAMLMLLWMTTRLQFCLTDNAIIYRPWPLDSMAVQPWSAVREIDVRCTPVKEGVPDLSYMLVMTDGTRLDISHIVQTSIADDAVEDLASAYPRIRKALRSTSFAFDASGIRKDCPLPALSPLRLKPQ